MLFDSTLAWLLNYLANLIDVGMARLNWHYFADTNCCLPFILSLNSPSFASTGNVEA